MRWTHCLNRKTYGRTTNFGFPSASCPNGALQLIVCFKHSIGTKKKHVISKNILTIENLAKPCKDARSNIQTQFLSGIKRKPDTSHRRRDTVIPIQDKSWKCICTHESKILMNMCINNETMPCMVWLEYVKTVELSSLNRSLITWELTTYLISSLTTKLTR